jgi:acyl-CoA reductase-like NAD-dependent aldehyde dehydrogenase
MYFTISIMHEVVTRVVAPSVPFGGYGWSGFGRENGISAVDEYLEPKSVWVELIGGTRDPFPVG